MSKIALFDMDGTLADYDKALLADLEKIRSPYEPVITDSHFDGNPDYVEQRRHMITNQSGWFLKLERFQLGWDVYEMCRDIGYKIAILTKGPQSKYSAWNEKIQWCHNHMGKDALDGVTITHDKSLVYGNVLVDDYPDYVTGWLKNRPRGLVIMPAHNFNKDFSHPQVIRYDGKNVNEVRVMLTLQYNRVSKNEE
jgi:5'-nucleotidase